MNVIEWNIINYESLKDLKCINVIYGSSKKINQRYNKSSRKKERFVCNSCGVEIDADLNAAINILHRGTNSAHVTKINPSNKIL